MGVPEEVDVTDREQFGTRVIPTLRYQDATAAIEWLGTAFGFEPRLVVPGNGRTVPHAQLVLGGVMIMLGSVRDDAFGQLQRPPQKPSGVCTQSPYIIVVDIEKHYKRASAAGAIIAMPLKAEDYGGKNYSCWDPEGHLWSFGSYNPWTDSSD